MTTSRQRMRLEVLETKMPRNNPWRPYFGTHPGTWPAEVLEEVVWAYGFEQDHDRQRNSHAWSLIYSMRAAADGERWPHTKRASAEALIEDRLDEMLAEITASIEAMKGVETQRDAKIWLDTNGTEIARRWFSIQR